jgi:HK97 family phage major capsid protein
MEIEKLVEETVNQVNAKLEKFKGEMPNKAELNALQSEVEKIKGFTEVSKTQTEAIKGLENSFVALNEKLKSYEPTTDDVNLFEGIKKAAETLKQKGEGKALVAEFKNKAVGNMTTGNLTGRVIQPTVLPGVNLVPRNVFVIRALSQVGQTVSNLIEWVEQKNIDGAAAMTGEGLKKSQVDFDMVTASTQVKKITAFVKITTEMLEDVPQMESIINGQLQYELAKIEEEQLIAGTGLTVFLKGIKEYAQALKLAALENTFALNASNRWDQIGAMITQIEENLGGAANAIFMRKSDLFLLTNGSRTTTGEYNYPVTVTPDGTFISGVRVITTNSIPAGFVLVADMTKFNIHDRTGMKIEMGYEGDDFVKNFVTIRAEYRLASHIKSNDVEGFVYSSFADAKAFLERNT